MIKNKTFICLEDYTYGFKGEPDNCVFIKGKSYNVVINNDYRDPYNKIIKTIKIIDDKGQWIRFSEENIYGKTILKKFIELKEYRKEKLKKIKLNYEKSN